MTPALHRTARFFALAFLLAACALAADWAELQPQGYVNDFAQVLSPQSRTSLERYCRQVEKATGAQIALVTISTLDGEPIEDVANLLYRRWGVGSKKQDEGVMVLLAIRDRRSRVEVGYGLEPALTDGFVGGVLRSMRTALRQSDYDLAMAEAAQALGEAIARSKNVSLAQDRPTGRARPRPQGFPWHAVLTALGVLLFVAFMGRSRGGSYQRGGAGNLLMGMLLGSMMSRGGRGPWIRGGGGFGGYDSGDSFGGFGGGDSGGGGASSDW